MESVSIRNLQKLWTIWFNETNAKLAKIANVNRETYRQAKRVLDSDNEDLKQRVLSGETAISTGYKELIDTGIAIFT